MSLQLIDKVIQTMESFNVASDSEWFWKYTKTRRNEFAEQLQCHLQYLSDCSKIVDFGAAPFVLDEALAYLGHNVTAVDLDPHRFHNISKLSTSLVKADVEYPCNFPNSLCDFDVAILSHVFEHLRINLIETLRGIRSTIKPGGLLFIETPNLLSTKGWFNLLFRKTAYSCAGSILHEWTKIETFGHMGHVREYTAFELKEILIGCGFAIEDISYAGMTMIKHPKQFPFWVIERIFPTTRQNIRILARRVEID